MIFRQGGKNCVVKNEKWIVVPKSLYVNSNPETLKNRQKEALVPTWKNQFEESISQTFRFLQ